MIVFFVNIVYYVSHQSTENIVISNLILKVELKSVISDKSEKFSLSD